MLGGISQNLLMEAFAEDASVATPPAFQSIGILDTLHCFEWSDGVSSGVVEIEAANNDTYAGTWSPIATITFAGTAPKVDSVPVHGSYKVFRHRISTIVTDGTLTSKIEGSL